MPVRHRCGWALKGTAKIYGPRRPLVLWLALRRPIQLVREWLSL